MVSDDQASIQNQSYILEAPQVANRSGHSARLSHAKEHVLAERKRREKLTQRFIALSAIVPGLKKVISSLNLCH